MKGEIPGSAGQNINVSNLDMAKLNSHATPCPCHVPLPPGWWWAADHGCSSLGVHVSALGTSSRKTFILLFEVKIIPFTDTQLQAKAKLVERTDGV